MLSIQFNDARYADYSLASHYARYDGQTLKVFTRVDNREIAMYKASGIASWSIN